MSGWDNVFFVGVRTLSKAPIPILDIRGVNKQFELQGQRIDALRDANLRVNKGEFVCLIGASGCGKSTLLRIVAGFEAPTQGDALMWDMPIVGPGPQQRHGVSGLRAVSLAERCAATLPSGRPRVDVRRKKFATRSSASFRWSVCSVSPTPIRISCLAE